MASHQVEQCRANQHPKNASRAPQTPTPKEPLPVYLSSEPVVFPSPFHYRALSPALADQVAHQCS
eukprot:4261253-Amphidinium_carterae.1